MTNQAAPRAAPEGATLGRRAAPLLALTAAAGLVGLAALAALGFSRVRPPATPFVAVGVTAIEATLDGGVRLDLDIRNETSLPVAGVLSVTTPGPGGAAATLWSGDVVASPGQDGIARFDLAAACGRPLTITLRARDVDRVVTTAVPCVGGAAGAGIAPVAASTAPTPTGR